MPPMKEHDRREALRDAAARLLHVERRYAGHRLESKRAKHYAAKLGAAWRELADPFEVPGPPPPPYWHLYSQR